MPGLILSRREGETIMIGDDIEITVENIRGDKVRIGVKAPTRIAVHRKEVYDAIKAEQQRRKVPVLAHPQGLLSDGPPKISGINRAAG